ncbi:unnamed protein product [Arabidopsis halleri]
MNPAYVTEFEDLSAQVTGLDDSHLEKIFFNGLKQEMKEVIKMKEPQRLPAQKAAVFRIESSSFCQMIGERNSKALVPARPNPGRDVVPYVPNRPVLLPGAATQRDKFYLRGNVILLKNLTRCGELQILTVVDGLELMVLDDEGTGEIEIVEENSPVMCCLSLNSFLGKHSPRTTKLIGFLGKSKVVVLIDSGASHNFLTPNLAAKLKMLVCEDSRLEVRLGNGVSVHGTGVCKDVKFQLPGVEFQSNFISLELGGVDVILGMERLETLGTCEVNWRKQEWHFTYNGKSVTLLGDSSLHYHALSLKSIAIPVQQVLENNVVRDLAAAQVLAVDKQMDPALSSVLTQFATIFELHAGLPPKRGQEHAIVLKPVVQSITVRPYKYPHSTKEVLEKMVADMVTAGIIRPSTSPFLGPILSVKKKDSSSWSENLQAHVEHLRSVLQLLAAHQLFANFKKCFFGTPQVDYLGHIISAAGLPTNTVKTEAMIQWPVPTNIKQLRDKFLWSEPAQQAFDTLKQAMAAVPVLGLPNFDKVFILETDASRTGVGTVLMQEKRPLAYFSHGLTTREQLKPAYERELMAIVMAVLKWKHYLMGRKFEVHTDQRSLKFLLEQKESKS